MAAQPQLHRHAATCHPHLLAAPRSPAVLLRQHRSAPDAAVCRAGPAVMGGKVYLDPVEQSVSAFAPATVANLGPGFDWMGCAVEVRLGQAGQAAAGTQAAGGRAEGGLPPMGQRALEPALPGLSHQPAHLWVNYLCTAGRARATW